MSKNGSLGDKIYEYDLEGNFLNEYSSLREAADLNNLSSGRLCDVLDFKKGFSYYNKIYTRTYYIKFPYEIIKQHQRKKEKLKIEKVIRNYKPIFQYDLDGNFVKKWLTISEASKELNISAPHTSQCLNSNFKQISGNFMWSYEYFEKIPAFIPNYHKSKKVIQYSLSGDYMATYSSARQAAIKNNLDRTTVSRCADGTRKNGGGYIWKYEDSL